MRRLATKAHAGQTYGGGAYTDHLAAVEAVLMACGPQGLDVGLWECVVIAAWGHDLLEDTAVTSTAIEECASSTVVDIIRAVTNQPGANRRERHAATYPRMGATPGAVMLKVADRIANMEAACSGMRSSDSTRRSTSRGKATMYLKESADFCAALSGNEASRLLLAGYWTRLDIAVREARSLVGHSQGEGSDVPPGAGHPPGVGHLPSEGSASRTKASRGLER